MPELSGMIAWGNGEPCPICQQPFDAADIQHLLTHPEAFQQLFPGGQDG